MMSKGFITTALWAKSPSADAVTTDLHFTDLEDGSEGAPVIAMWVIENDDEVRFTLEHAEAAVEAMQEIIARYKDQPR